MARLVEKRYDSRLDARERATTPNSSVLGTREARSPAGRSSRGHRMVHQHRSCPISGALGHLSNGRRSIMRHLQRPCRRHDDDAVRAHRVLFAVRRPLHREGGSRAAPVSAMPCAREQSSGLRHDARGISRQLTPPPFLCFVSGTVVERCLRAGCDGHPPPPPPRGRRGDFC